MVYLLDTERWIRELGEFFIQQLVVWIRRLRYVIDAYRFGLIFEVYLDGRHVFEIYQGAISVVWCQIIFRQEISTEDWLLNISYRDWECKLSSGKMDWHLPNAVAFDP